MTTAFQSNAFQNNAFQIEDEEEAPPVFISGAIQYVPIRKQKKDFALILAIYEAFEMYE